MNEELEKKCADWIEATGAWLVMPPDDKIPAELEMVAYMGNGPECSVLVVRCKDTDGEFIFDGTATPRTHTFSMIHLTRALAEKAFLKAEAFLKP